MSLVKSFVKFVSDVKSVPKLAELEPGRAGAEGFVRLGRDGPLTSPVRGNPCVAFYYKAFHVVGSRTGAMMPRKLKIHEVYHSFDLELDDGRLFAVPKKSDTFTSDDHKELGGSGYQGFRATEDLVSPGMRVKIFGVAKETDDGWELTYSKLELIPYTPPADSSGKKKRKKKKTNLKSKSKAKKSR